MTLGSLSHIFNLIKSPSIDTHKQINTHLSTQSAVYGDILMSINNAHRLSITLWKGNEWDLHIYRAGFTHALTGRPETAALSTLTHRGRGGGGTRCGTAEPEICEQTPPRYSD